MMPSLNENLSTGISHETTTVNMTESMNMTAESLTVQEVHVAKLVIVSLIVAILSVITAGGNLLVILSIQMDKQLQTITNYFLLSLSVADLTIGKSCVQITYFF